MKTNGHYAGAAPMPGFQDVENGLRPDQVGVEGTDMFRLEGPYLEAYAAHVQGVGIQWAGKRRFAWTQLKHDLTTARTPTCTGASPWRAAA